MSLKQNIEYKYSANATSFLKVTNQVTGALKDVQNLASGLFSGLSAYTLSSTLVKATEETISYQETLNMFKVVMADSIDVGKQFVDQVQEIYGMDPSNIMEATGNFYQLTSAIDISQKASQKMSTGLTKLAIDMASLFDVPIEQVMSNLSSGLWGMTRAVSKYGMNVRAAAIQVEAENLGLTEKVANMTEADREGLRYIAMMRQARVASSDFANTIESPANQLRIFKEQVTQLTRAIGNFFLPVIKTVLPYINGFVMALRTILTFIADVRGIFKNDYGDSLQKSTEAETSALGTLGDTASDTAKKMKDLFAPFDELNTLNESSAKGSGASTGIGSDEIMNPAIEAAILALNTELESVKMKANEVRDSLLKFFGFVEVDGKLKFISSSFEKNLIKKFPQWSKTITAFFDSWEGITTGFKSVWTSAVNYISSTSSKVFGKIKELLGGDKIDDKLSERIRKLPESLQSLSSWIDNNHDKISSFLKTLGAFKVISTITPIVTGGFSSMVGALNKAKDAYNSLSSADQLLGSALQGTALSALAPVIAITALVVMLVAAYATSEDFRKSVNNTFKSIGKIVSTIWLNIVQPVLSEMSKVIKDLWYNSILPVFEDFGSIISDVASLVAWLLPYIIDIIKPFVPFLVNYILAPIKVAVGTTMAFIGTIVEVVRTIIDSIKKLAKGDWKGAWETFKTIPSIILKGLYKVFYSIVNNMWTLIKGFLNGVGGALKTVGGFFGKDWGFTINASLPTPDEVFMASGGVVSGPTRAVVGEGKYSEAVVPLGNSPELSQMLDSFADRVNNVPLDVRVQIGDSSWEAFTYKSNKRGASRVGATPIGGRIRV